MRFAATFAANVTRAAVSFFTGIVIARALGANEYGELNFLMGSFAALTQLLDAGSTSAFYTFLSARRRTAPFFIIYFVWKFGLQFLATMAILGALLPRSVINALWLGHDRGTVLLAFAASFMVSQTWNSVAQMGEAVRKTILVQIAATCQAVVHLGLVLAAIAFHWLSVPVVLWLTTIEYLVVALVLAPKLLSMSLRRSEPEPLREVTGEFIRYCKPIVVYAAVGFGYHFADRWFLQRFGGAVQQGFFAVGQQFASISLLATTSVINVFWKEIAEANERGDKARVRSVYDRVRHFLYFGAAAISCALIPYSREILHWTVGDAYEGGTLCLALMFLYPIHQTLGQIQGTFYLAVGDTTRYAVIGLILMMVSIPIAYLMVAPRTAVVPGLALGAVGLAIKMVVLQIAGIAVQMHLLKRWHGLETDYAYQVGIVVALLAFATMLKLATGGTSLVRVGVAMTIYTVVLGGIVIRMPSLVGLQQRHIDRLFEKLHAIGLWRARRA